LAGNNAVRAMAAVSLVNAFWYMSEWSSGGAAATFAGLVSVLLATRDDPARDALNFLKGAALANLIGTVAHYAVLTSTGDFLLLAAVVLPISMLAAAGRADKRAVSAGGFGITVFSALDPLNVMDYDLASALNGVLANLLGVATAVLAFAALPLPASAATRRVRARWRIGRAVSAAARRPAILLPHPSRWCAPMFERAALLAPEGTGAVAEAHTLMLAGLLLLVLRRQDDALGRQAGRVITKGGPELSEGLARLQASSSQGLQRRRLAALAALLEPGVLLAVLVAAVALTWLAWNYYEYSPWTRDGRGRVYTVQVAPEVSGTVVDLSIKDNQFVRKGDVLFRIDPETYQNAVKQAEGKLAQARAQAGYLVDEAKRRRALSDLAVSREQQENATGVAQAANDATLQSVGEMAQASLNLERTEIRSPVNGWVTNLLLQSGGFATTGTTAMTLVNAASFWIEGYFEETQLRRIKASDPVEAALLAYPGVVVTGHVSGLGRGIDVPNAAPGVQGLPSVNPVFTWVRLAQRVPVRVELEDMPCPVVLSSGLTATVTVTDGRAGTRAPGPGWVGSDAGQGCAEPGR